ncbi:MAG: DUF4124 domain-containing protein [Methylotenera sp.]|jgi:Domain of unknown function (DUF4124)
MKRQFIFISTCLFTFFLPILGYADIYKHVDADGRVTYSNVKIKGAKKINLEPADTNFGTQNNSETNVPKSKPAPANFPKVDAETQKNRDNSRKKILMSELESEKIALEQAKKAYEEGKANPEVHRLPNGGIRRNVVKYEEKMQKLQADVDAHQRNIELLEKEISNIN